MNRAVETHAASWSETQNKTTGTKPSGLTSDGRLQEQYFSKEEKHPPRQKDVVPQTVKGAIVMIENKFIGYEYKTVSVNHQMESVYADGYQNFGWETEGTPESSATVGMVSMRFKRNRKILNKAELTRLQRQFDACVDEIVALERSKSTVASIVAYVIGLVGCAFMAGSVFAITSASPNIMLCAILAIPGFVGWILPYFCFTSVRRKKTNALTPLIDKKYDEIYEVCEKANKLLTSA